MRDEEKFMKEAIRQAKKAYALREVPIGCVIVYEGKIIARGYNKRNKEKNTLSHAEMNAIRKASKYLGDWRLEGCTMYITLEPCPMCAAACSLARLARVVWGADDPDCGGMRGAIDVAAKAHLNHRPEMTPGVRRAECEKILQDFFKAKRKKAQA